MSAAGRDGDRQVIPRWRDLARTVAHRELGPTRTRVVAAAQPSAEELRGLEERQQEFATHRTLSFAADLLSASIVLGPTPETLAAARLISSDRRSSAMVLDTASSVVAQAAEAGGAAHVDVEGLDEPETRHRQIAQLRHGLRANPRNAVRWVELAREYTTEGHEFKAARAMRSAVAMAPHDRFVLRCAARLWVHLGDPERAVNTFRHARSAMLADPWLMAAEVATTATAGRPSKNIKHARHMLDGGRHVPFAMSELASALATLELQAGDVRRARRLFRTALVDPNEN
ncbi:MAG TPA: hypothetical protein VE010_01580, partial [Thermoanaerobaculia bacterium]|nr:hypothetical protein [Thermoanaerobaculia bacterium]